MEMCESNKMFRQESGGPAGGGNTGCGCGMTCEDKMALLRQIRVCTFALIEANLFLDTHPDDLKALAFYREHLEKLRHLKKKWEDETGEVFSEDGCRWAWVNTPWPWQSHM